METDSPECHAMLEKIAVVPEKLHPGDAIICTRFLFHRSAKFKVDNIPAAKARYTVRYVPSEAVLQGFEMSRTPEGKPAMIPLPEWEVGHAHEQNPSSYPPV